MNSFAIFALRLALRRPVMGLVMMLIAGGLASTGHLPRWAYANWELRTMALLGVDAPTQSDATVTASLRAVRPGFFAAQGIHVVCGREFAAADSAADSGVLVISDALARSAFGEGALGKRLTVRTSGGAEVTGTVVGIVSGNDAGGGAPLHSVYIPQAGAPARFLPALV